MSASPKDGMIGVAVPGPRPITPSLSRRAAELWWTRKHDTHAIAKQLGMKESDVDRIVHSEGRPG